MELPDMVKKKSGCSFRYNRCVRRNKVYSLGDGIHDGHDGIMSGGLRELDHEIHTERIPLRVRNGEWLPSTHLRA